MRKTTTKALALLMCATLAFGSSNIAVYADEVTITPETTTEASSTTEENTSTEVDTSSWYMPDVTTVDTAKSSTSPEGTIVSKYTSITSGKDDKGSYDETTEVTDTQYADGSSKEEGLVQGEHYVYDEDYYSGETSISKTIDEWKSSPSSSENRNDVRETIGDKPDSDDDQEYDYTEEYITGRITDVNVSQIETDVNESDNANDLDYLDPTYPEKTDITVGSSNAYRPVGNKPVGYDYYYSGNGAQVDSKYQAVFTRGKDGKITTSVTQFILRDTTNGSNQVAYCCDLNTYTSSGSWYTMENVNDATYYNEDAANHIKFITKNGYWGTASGTGSLSNFKEVLKKYGKSSGVSESFIDSLTAGQAEIITQCAIWMYANHDTGNWKFSKITGDTSSNDLYALVQVLANESVEDKDEIKDTDVLNKDNALKSLGFTIKDKATGYIENEDSDSSNDVYNVNVSFALGVTITDNDDLIVKIINTNGEVVKTCRLAGDNSSTNYDIITPNNDGVYVISGLELAEGSTHTFTMKLEGAQYLQEGVYLYTANGGHSKSQTFIGIAEGKRTVDLSTNVSFSFNVYESKYTAEHKWSRTWVEESVPEIEPEIPENPDVPEVPDVPETPTAPDVPDETPDVPDETPDVPVEVPVEDVVPEEPTIETPVEEVVEDSEKEVTEVVAKKSKIASTSPKTGDTSMIDVCLVLMLACICIAAACISRRIDLNNIDEEEKRSRNNSRGNFR